MSGHTKPSTVWVEDVILAVGNNPWLLQSKPILKTPSTGDPVQTVMAYGFGRSDGVVFPKKRGSKELALIEGVINGPKGTWFRGNKCSADINGKTHKGARQIVRSVSSGY